MALLLAFTNTQLFSHMCWVYESIHTHVFSTVVFTSADSTFELSAPLTHTHSVTENVFVPLMISFLV